jgi:hypothetical protein
LIPAKFLNLALDSRVFCLLLLLLLLPLVIGVCIVILRIFR